MLTRLGALMNYAKGTLTAEDNFALHVTRRINPTGKYKEIVKQLDTALQAPIV